MSSAEDSRSKEVDLEPKFGYDFSAIYLTLKVDPQ
jgi:hypothetical protein